MNSKIASSPFISSNPIYNLAVRQDFANEEIQFGPTIDVLEMLFKNMSFGNFFINILDFRDFTYPYNSPNSIEVMGYTNEQMTNLEWLLTIIDPLHLPIFNDYAVKVVSFLTGLPAERKKRVMLNHSLHLLHGVRKEYLWFYQQHHMSYIDKNGALVYSLSFITDVTHLHGENDLPTWSITERMEDGTYVYLIGSASEHLKAPDKVLLTTREMDIINLSARGLTIKEMAKRLRIGYETIITHRKKILRKTRSKNMPEAVAFAINLGYL